jgi:hypothetical protein
LLIRAIGSGYRAFDTSWSTKSAGMPLDEQPDVDDVSGSARARRPRSRAGYPEQTAPR